MFAGDCGGKFYRRGGGGGEEPEPPGHGLLGLGLPGQGMREPWEPKPWSEGRSILYGCQEKRTRGHPLEDIPGDVHPQWH